MLREFIDWVYSSSTLAKAICISIIVLMLSYTVTVSIMQTNSMREHTASASDVVMLKTVDGDYVTVDAGDYAQANDAWRKTHPEG